MKNFIRFLSLALAITIFAIVVVFPSAIPVKELLFEKKIRPKVGEIAFSPKKSQSSDNIKQIDVMFKSGNENLVYKISSFSFRLLYPIEGENDFVTVGPTGERANQISPNEIIANSSGWTVAVNEVKREEGKVTVDFAAIYKGNSGFSASDYITIASIYLDEGSLKQEDLDKLSLESGHCLMYTKVKPIEDILRKDIKILYN